MSTSASGAADEQQLERAAALKEESAEKLPVEGDDDTPSSPKPLQSSPGPKSKHKCQCVIVQSDIKHLLKDVKTKSLELFDRAPLNGGLIHWALQDTFITLNLLEGQLDGHIQACSFFFKFFQIPDSTLIYARKNYFLKKGGRERYIFTLTDSGTSRPTD